MVLDNQKKKELAKAYTQSFRPMGIYQIRNVENGKIYVDGSMDLEGMRNRIEFMKQMNMNNMSELQEDWNKYGASSFVFEELDQIKPLEEVVTDRAELKKYKDEVAALLELWLEKLQPYGDKGYNRPKRR